MRFTPAQQEHVRNWFESRFGNKPCSECGSSAGYQGYPGLLGVEQTDEPGGMPLVAFLCRGCGHTRLFEAGKVGIHIEP